jgi:glyoxylate utilization-related uncharacterized protein
MRPPRTPSVTALAGGLVYDFPDARSRIPPHTHEQMSHYSYVLAGQFEISCDDGTMIMQPGNFIDFACGENHYLQPLGAAVVFNRFHAPCSSWDELEGLIERDLNNLSKVYS